MDIDQPKPRVNASMIPKFIGSYVTVVGRSQGSSMGSTSLQIESGDRQLVTVHFQQPLSEPLSSFVEVVGKVEPDCSLSVVRYINFGEDFGGCGNRRKTIQYCYVQPGDSSYY